MGRGKIIVIEGTDGCGKETQSKLLEKYLVEYMGIDTVRYSFPQYNTKGAGPVEMYLNGELGSIEDMTPSQISSFYAVDRLCTIKSQKWEEMLDNGICIICDRYVESNIIYQASKQPKHMMDNVITDIKYLEYSLLGIPKPDIIFYLDLDESISERLINNRGEKKDIHEQNLEYMRKVHRCGTKIAMLEGWKIIDCNNDDYSDILPMEMIHYMIKEKLDPLLKDYINNK